MIKDILVYFSIFLGLFISFFYSIGYLSKKYNSKKLKDYFPMVSVIIPAYNEEKGILKTINSVLASDYPKNKYEIIVVDDGSKDKTFEMANSIKYKNLRVFRQKNQGKGGALNFGISKAKGEIIFTMDADSYISSDAMRLIARPFQNPKVMCVSSTVAVHNPKTILERVQQIEYMFGLFLRESLSSFNALHITPGAFSAYRKIFFEKHGGFAINNLTEDLEMGLRVQANGYIIENAKDAIVYTNAPTKFKELMIQRRRWYTGLLRNILDYRRVFSKKYGALGMVVLPLAVLTVFVMVPTTIAITFDSLVNLKEQITIWQSTNFDIFNSFRWDSNMFEQYFFNIFSSPTILFFFVLLLFSLAYLIIAKKSIKKHSSFILSFTIFIFLYTILSSFWWIVCFIYTITKKNISWK